MLDLLDSHDTNRALYVMTETGDSGLAQAKQRLELAALFQFTYIGAPMVFYAMKLRSTRRRQAAAPPGRSAILTPGRLIPGPIRPATPPFMGRPVPRCRRITPRSATYVSST